MLTPRDNFLETVHGGKPDRFVNQYEGYVLIRSDPLHKLNKRIKGQDTLDSWGVTYRWKEEDVSATPYITDKTKVCPDIECWRETVKAPSLDVPDSDWEPAYEQLKSIDRREQMAFGFCNGGLFERSHFLMGFEDALCNLLVEPELMHEFLDYLTEWRLEYLERLTSKLDLDGVFFHDDWGSKTSTFMSREVWQEFFKPRYDKLYSYVRGKGLMVIHHADSYCKPIVPDMVDLGISVWQGALPSNDIAALQKQTMGKITYQGGLAMDTIDHVDPCEAEIRAEVARACREYREGGFFIPSVTYGDPSAIYPGVYDIISDEIRNQNEFYFGIRG